MVLGSGFGSLYFWGLEWFRFVVWGVKKALRFEVSGLRFQV